MSKTKVTDPSLLEQLNQTEELNKEKQPKKVRTKVNNAELLAMLNEDIEAPIKTQKTVEDVVNDIPEYAMEYTSPWEYLEGVAETVESIGRGAVAGVTGFAGDIESLGRMAFAGKDNQETTLPTSQDMRENINYVVGEQKLNQLDPKGAEAGGFIGEVLAPVGIIGKTVVKGSKYLSDKVVKSNVLKQALADPVGKYDGALATVKLNNSGEVVKDVVGQRLVDLDVNPETVSYITNTDKANKKAMAEILQRANKGVGNKLYSSANPTTEVIGESVVKRLNALSGRRKALGKSLGEVVDTELKSLQFPVEALNKSFGTAMKKAFDVGMEGVEKLPSATKRNLIELNRLISAQTDTGVLSGKQIHNLKKILDDLRDVGAKDNMSRGVDSIIGALRKDVNTKLGEASSQYRSLNQRLSSILEAESSFVRLDDTRKFMNDEALRKKVGSKLKDLGNSEKALNSDWQASLRLLDDTLKDMGIVFKDDPLMLTEFAKQAKQFASVNDATILRYGSKDARRSALKMVANSGIGNTFGAMNNISNLVDSGISAKNARKAMDNHFKAYDLMLKELRK